MRKSNTAKVKHLERPDSCEPEHQSSTSSLFLIGKDSHGNWVARDQAGRCGGLFVNRTEALRFAMQENGGHPQAVIMVPGVLELTANFWSSAAVTYARDARGLKAAANG